MPSPAKIAELFRSLRVRYGAKLISAYPDLNIEDVARDWALVLESTQDYAVDYGIVNLPISWPPTALEFRAICAGAPVRRPKALPEPKADPAIAAAALAKLRTLRVGDRDPRAWIQRLYEREAAGEVLNNHQQFCLAEAAKNLAGHGLSDLEVTSEDAQRTKSLKDVAAKRVADYLATRR